ncbi:glucose/arabinose dehydrogenase [Kribbella antiqua]|uniref:Glucose/arabinose dehydrogenase n=1 Tax=Kribbella antiqua TaxID=2512217 RepID=A0A4R2IJS9_9ACTN|nr:PQQ-dependent sugar dehydrogenase [Kribbella antiqua]TCO44068.1 glucose/arabinose dehydrogenase [Kribbella antiqua]
MFSSAISSHRLLSATIGLLLVLATLVAVPTAPARAVVVPAGFSEQVVFSGLTAPTNVAFAADGRVFVSEKSGLIKEFDSLDDPTPTVFADLRTKVHNYWDRGLLGLALHPNFPVDPRVYVLYTHDALIGGQAPKWGTAGTDSDPCPSPPGPTSDGCQVSARLSALTPTASGVAEQVLVEDWCQVFPSHSIGSIEFGPDGMLYAGGGDGGNFNLVDYGQDNFTTSDVTPDNPCGDPPSPVGTALAPPTAEGGALRSQDVRTSADPATLDGSIVRLNPDTGEAAAGNPKASSTDPNTRRIVAHGLRNPMRFDFRPGTSEIWVGDVGWRDWEEIDRIVSPTASVTNFGWPCYEGAARQAGYDGANVNICENLYAAGASAVVSPYYTYNHTAQVAGACSTGSSSIAGMSFYEGGNYPAQYDGALFFADYSRGCVWAMLPGANGLPNPANIINFASGYGTVALRTGPGGDIFAVDYENGRIMRYVYSATNNPPTAVISADPTSGPTPLTVNFDGTASNDADGDTLTYAWDLDGDGEYVDSTAATPQYTYTTSGTVTVRLRVNDGQGGTNTTTAQINVANTAPTATITAPGPATTWKVGDTINFSGTATDPEQGTLPGSALSWSLIMHHCPSDCHSHQITSMTGASGSFTTPDHEYPSYLELKLTATDSSGLTDVKSVRLDPKTVPLTITSQPTGLKVTYLAKTATSPSSNTAIVGSSGSLSTDLLQLSANKVYRFASWSDGGTRSHNFVTPATATTYTANYIPKRNLALNKPVAVSSVEATGREGAKAADGSMSTRWASAHSDPQWLRVDLGMVRVVNRVLLNWHTAYAKGYQIQVSGNGQTWQTVYSTATGDGGTDHVTFTPVWARYVRIYGTARTAAANPYSLYEVGVFGDSGLITGIGGKCVDVTGNNSSDGTQIELYTCYGNAPNQQWTQYEDGTIHSLGKCLDARSGTTSLTPVVLWTCDGSGGQTWVPRTDGSLVNLRSGRCLNAKSGTSTNGTPLIIYTCVNAANEKWVLP